MRSALLLTVLLLGSTSQAQITFERTYAMPGASMNFGFSVQQTDDGGYILAGGSDMGAANFMDIALMKVDAWGEPEWQRTYGWTLLDMAYCVRQVSDGGYILCGVFSGFGNDTLALIRTDALGEPLWERRYSGGLGRDIGYNVVETSDGGFAVCGFTGADPQLDALVIRVDSQGELLWTSVFDLGATEYANAIRQLPDGGFIVLCDNGEIGGLGDGVLHLLRLNTDGGLMWSSAFSATEGLSARGLCVNGDGGFTIAGTVGYPQRDVILLRSDAQGEELWRAVHGAAGLDETTYDVLQTADGGFIAGGRKEEVFNGIGMYLLRTDADGVIVWERTWSRGIMSEAFSLDITSDGGFALFGHTVDTISGQLIGDMYLVKTNEDGIVGMHEPIQAEGSLWVGPVPASDMLHLTCDGFDPHRIELLDMAGRMLREWPWSAVQGHGVPVHFLAPGGYLISVIDAGGQRITRRFVMAR
jgi:hypothetical protein